jgi:hypothetical protein
MRVQITIEDIPTTRDGVKVVCTPSLETLVKMQKLASTPATEMAIIGCFSMLKSSKLVGDLKAKRIIRN